MENQTQEKIEQQNRNCDDLGAVVELGGHGTKHSCLQQ